MFIMLQISKEKQFTTGKATFVQAQKAEDILVQEKLLLKASL